MKFFRGYAFILVCASLTFSTSCNPNTADDKPMPVAAAEMDILVQQSLKQMLTTAATKDGATGGAPGIFAAKLLASYYEPHDFKQLWSSQRQWRPVKDSLLKYLHTCERDGLFPKAYQLDTLQALISRIDFDSLQLQPASSWARADVLMTDAFMHILEDLKHGRLHMDSLSWKYDESRYEKFFTKYLDSLLVGTSITHLLQGIQPGFREYQQLKEALPTFLDSMQRKTYTYLQYPLRDSALLYKKVVARIKEEGVAGPFSEIPDSLAFVKIISAYQSFKGLPVTGKLTAGLVNRLNNTDLEKFKRIAITLDRYKQLAAPLPERYVWVNLPSYYLQVWAGDTIELDSKIIIGKPHTPTPLISSAISDLVIYPTWTVPGSIIKKEILPALKRDPGYLLRKGLALFDYNGNMVDPFAVNWAKYNTEIPYLVRQASGDDNALGVMKFNFKNPFSVYLHDTNQRYLFKNKSRSLSHGCVRVQEWEKLAFFIVRNDRMFSKQPDSLKLTTDSITSWVARKQKQVVGIRNRLPLFIGYYTCAATKGKIRFYDDVYSKDKVAREKYAAFK